MTDMFAFPKPPNRPIPTLPIRWVETDDELYALIDEIDDVDVVALDTEFVRRTTYYPILALVQVNTGKGIYLVDAPKLDLSEFWQALSEVPTMLWYACGEDLTIFYHLAKCPPLTNIIDIQIGIAYLTSLMQVGYAQAVFEVLGVTLDKAESQSDWLVRPLSDNQQNYAISDVQYLPTLYEVIKETLVAKNLFDCVIEDSLLYAKEIHTALHTPNEQVYLDYLDPKYNQRQITLLQALTSWRERLARVKNKPRTFIIDKQGLRDIIDTMPTTTKALANTSINRNALRRYGDDIVRIIKQVTSLPKEQLITLPPPPYTSKNKPFKKELSQALAAHSQATQIPESLLMRGRWLNQLLYMIYQELDDEHLPDGLKGYRHEWVIAHILPLLREYKEQIADGFILGNNQRG
ncbi:ribonuclease D [Moraxella oblonga]|uniref:ribonuclease D n=1 Tax=Moraxella oblonga TaxID=200413 RepID=UPI0008357D80|nr:HRDC domain-containing protein [Moraxella oblonga]